MALNKLVNLYGMDFPDAYIVVTRVEYDKGLNLPTDPSTREGDSYYDILVYPNKSARDSDSEPMESKRIIFNMDTQSKLNPIEQAYTHLKSLDEYIESTDT